MKGVERFLYSLIFAMLPMLVLTMVTVLAGVWPTHGNATDVPDWAMLAGYGVGFVLVWVTVGRW